MAGLTKAAKIVVASVGLLTLVLGAFLLACQPTAEAPAEARPEDGCALPKEVKTVDLPESSVVPKVSIPPIDASAPAKTETATFSLG